MGAFILVEEKIIMKKNKAMRVKAKYSLLLTIFLFSCAFIAFYFIYPHSEPIELHRVNTSPRNGIENLSRGWRIYTISFANGNIDSIIDNLQITINPQFKFKKYVASEQDIYRVLMTHEKSAINKSFKENFNIQNGFDLYLAQRYSDKKMLVIERTDGLLEPNTNYSIEISDRRNTITNLLHNPNKLKYTFSTGSESEDEFEMRRKKFNSSLGSYEVSIGQKTERNELNVTCPIAFIKEKNQYFEIDFAICGKDDNDKGLIIVTLFKDPQTSREKFEEFIDNIRVNPESYVINYFDNSPTPKQLF
jgi:preprotein translocase subunit YajC